MWYAVTRSQRRLTKRSFNKCSILLQVIRWLRKGNTSTGASLQFALSNRCSACASVVFVIPNVVKLIKKRNMCCCPEVCVYSHTQPCWPADFMLPIEELNPQCYTEWLYCFSNTTHKSCQKTKLLSILCFMFLLYPIQMMYYCLIKRILSGKFWHYLLHRVTKHGSWKNLPLRT